MAVSEDEAKTFLKKKNKFKENVKNINRINLVLWLFIQSFIVTKFKITTHAI